MNLGIGLALRPAHYEQVFADEPRVDWFEIISEHFMMGGGRSYEVLERILERYPVVQHGVTLSIGSPEPLDWDHLKQLKMLIQKTKTPWLSEHLSWGTLPTADFHELLPIPHTEEMVEHVAERARIIQDFLEIPLALENLTAYLSFGNDDMPEWEFFSSIAEKAAILMALNINHLYTSAQIHHFDPQTYIDHLPLERVVQIQLSSDDHLWDIYEKVHPRTPNASTLLDEILCAC